MNGLEGYGQVGEQQPALPAGERLVDPPTGQLHGESAAELHPGRADYVLHVAHLGASTLNLENTSGKVSL